MDHQPAHIKVSVIQVRGCFDDHADGSGGKALISGAFGDVDMAEVNGMGGRLVMSFRSFLLK